MRSGLLCFLLALTSCICLPARGQASGGDFSTNLHPTEKQKVPAGVILVKGAWSSASDSVNPVPEGGNVAADTYTNQYFGITYPLPQGWIEKHKGPPPSDSGSYVLASLTPPANYKGASRGMVLITADDMFFTPLPAANALELVNYKKKNLPADYKLESQLPETKLAGRTFSFYAYWSPAAELHWYVLATEIRCHTVQIVLTSRDTKLLESLVLDMSKMKLPAEASPTAGRGGGDFPVCVKDYANQDNVAERVEPVFTDRRFNPVPVRILIDKEGKVKHIHFLSAFPEQAKAISDALAHWRFRPYLRGGKPVEVETGIMFGRSRAPVAPATSAVQE